MKRGDMVLVGQLGVCVVLRSYSGGEQGERVAFERLEPPGGGGDVPAWRCRVIVRPLDEHVERARDVLKRRK